MAAQRHVTEGTVAFQSLREHDSFNGQTTGKYTLTIMLPDDSAQELEDQGVKLKDYEGKSQRKFSSKFSVPILNPDGSPFEGDVTRGSKVRIQYLYGIPHPVHGVATYLNAVKVLEVAEATGTDTSF